MTKSRTEIPEATVWVDVDATALLDMRVAALEAERTALAKLFKERKINDTTLRAISGELTLSQALSQARRK